MGLFPPHKTPLPPLKETKERVVVTGVGTISPQGLSTWTTALGLRFRKTAWCEHETVLVPHDPDGIVLRGAIVSRLPEEFIDPQCDGAERTAALLSPAVRDALAGLLPRQVRSLRCRLQTCLGDTDALAEYLRGEFPLLSLSPHDGEITKGLSAGRAGFFENIIDAAEELQKGRTERILVGCVDSLCATSWLMSVRDESVLKDSFTPEGIIAGEAAGAVLLERESLARARKAPILAVLSSWGRGQEAAVVNTCTPTVGRGLTDACEEAFSSLERGGRSIGAVICDLNGQRHRALDWAYAEGRIFRDSEQETELRHPVFISGDCGNATGAVLLADALGLFIFHPRLSRRIALVASDDGGTRRVLVLERGDHRPRRELIEEIRTLKLREEAAG